MYVHMEKVKRHLCCLLSRDMLLYAASSADFDTRFEAVRRTEHSIFMEIRI